VGVLFVVTGVTLLSGAVAAWVGLSGAAIIAAAAVRALTMTPGEYRREQPVPPGSG
jgi:hypothetical protein